MSLNSTSPLICDFSSINILEKFLVICDNLKTSQMNLVIFCIPTFFPLVCSVVRTQCKTHATWKIRVNGLVYVISEASGQQ